MREILWSIIMLYLFLLVLTMFIVPMLLIAYSAGFVAAIFDIIRLHKKPQKEPYNTWLPDDHKHN